MANYYIQKIKPSAFNIKKLGKAKKSTIEKNAFNLDYFGGNPMFTVCNLATEGKIIAETRNLVGSKTFNKPQTTLLVFDDGTAKMETTNNLKKYSNLRCAIGGVPFMINGKEVSLSKDIKTQGWSGGNFYKTWHSFLTVQNGEIWYIGAYTGHSNDVTATTVIWKFLKSIGCTGTVIKLDGGGSFIFKKSGKIVEATDENRVINYIGTWEDDPILKLITTKILLNGKEKEVEAVVVDNQNFIKLRDLADEYIKIDYDATKKLPVVKVANK